MAHIVRMPDRRAPDRMLVPPCPYCAAVEHCTVILRTPTALVIDCQQCHQCWSLPRAELEMA